MFHHSGFHTLSKLWSLFLVTHLGRRCKSRFTCSCEKDSIFIRGLFPSNSCIEKVCIGFLFCCNIYSCPCTSNDLFKFTVLWHTLEETLSDVFVVQFCCLRVLCLPPLSESMGRFWWAVAWLGKHWKFLKIWNCGITWSIVTGIHYCIALLNVIICNHSSRIMMCQFSFDSLLDKKAAAVDLINARLLVMPTEPKLWYVAKAIFDMFSVWHVK